MARNWLSALSELRTPAWFRRYYGERLTGLIAGLFHDVIMEGATEALFAPWLREPTSPDDALKWIGIERSIEQFPGESFDSYRGRLIDAWNAWTYAGNESAIVSQLEGLGFSDIEVKTYRTAGWDWDSGAGLTWAEGVGGSANWSRFWVVIKGHPWVGEGTFADPGLYGDGGVVGLSATPEEIGALKRLILKWKPGHVQAAWVIIVMDSATWDLEQPDGTWHDWRNRSKSARYIPVQQRPVILP